MDMTLKAMAEQVYLGLVLWREARGEDHLTKCAVAQSVLTRVKHPGWWGSDLMSVIFKPWQYSSMTDPKDPQLTRWPSSADAAWWECLQIAADVIAGKAPDPMTDADSYYDTSIPAPRWASPATYIGQLGRIVFHSVRRAPPVA